MNRENNNYIFINNSIRHSLILQFYNNSGGFRGIRDFSSTITTSNEFQDENRKHAFIKREWDLSYPNHSHVTYEQILILANKMASTATWLKETQIKYSLQAQVPDWFSEMSDKSEWTLEFQKQLDSLNKLKKLHYSNLNDKAREYRKSIDEAGALYEKNIRAELDKHPELIIGLLTVSSLDLEIHVQALEIGDSEGQRTFLKSKLKDLQSKLYTKYKLGTITSDDLFELLFAKG
jgi:hypothetical protein